MKNHNDKRVQNALLENMQDGFFLFTQLFEHISKQEKTKNVHDITTSAI